MNWFCVILQALSRNFQFGSDIKITKVPIVIYSIKIDPTDLK